MFTRIMFNRLGTQWALTLLAFLSVLFAPIPFIFYYYGARIRAHSTFAPGHTPAATPAPSAPATAAPSAAPSTHRSSHETVRDMQAELDLGEEVDRQDEITQEKKQGVYRGQETRA